MPSSLFDCRKKTQQNKTKTKKGVYKPKTKYPIQTLRLVLVATFIFAHPRNRGLHFTWRIKILPIQIMIRLSYN